MFIYLWSHVNKKTKTVQWKQRHEILMGSTDMDGFAFRLLMPDNEKLYIQYKITVKGARQVVLLEKIK